MRDRAARLRVEPLPEPEAVTVESPEEVSAQIGSSSQHAQAQQCMVQFGGCGGSTDGIEDVGEQLRHPGIGFVKLSFESDGHRHKSF